MLTTYELLDCQINAVENSVEARELMVPAIIAATMNSYSL
jgi:hypothetical protein